MKKILKNYLNPYRFWAGMSVLALFLSIYGGVKAAGGPAPDQCCLCHRKVCEDTADKRYVHAPFREKQCALCHIASSAKEGGNIAKDGEIPVKWLAGGTGRQDMEHWFSLPPSLAGKKIILQVDGVGKKTVRNEVVLPNFVEAEQLAAVSKPPELSEISVDEVKQGVFLTARITWKSDRVTDTVVLYGESDASRKSIGDSQLTKDHEVLLTDLKPNKIYSYVVVAQDIFGNKSVSPAKTFSTQTFFSRPREEKAKTNEKMTFAGKYFRADNRFFARFIANQPVSVRVGTQADTLTSAKESSARTGTLPPEHLPLADPRFLNTGVCFSCHPKTKGVLSHPVDVRPKRGMIVDGREYKLLGDGRLTCMTCHVPHASDNENRIIRSDKKKMCLGCHKNFG